MRRVLLLAPALALLAITLGAGLVGAVAQSLGFDSGLPGTPIGLDAYRAVWADPAVRASLALSARVALLSTALATGLGVGLALALRASTRARRGLAGVLTSTVAVPHVVGATAIGLLLSETGLASRVAHALGLVGPPAAFVSPVGDRFGWGIVADYVWKEAPFVALVTLVALGRGVAELEDAARTLGAGPGQRLVRVILPVIAPTVLGAAVLVFAFAAGSYEVPYLLGRPYPATLPVVAYQDFRATDLSVQPQAMALSVLITALSALVVVALVVVTRLPRRRRRGTAER